MGEIWVDLNSIFPFYVMSILFSSITIVQGKRSRELKKKNRALKGTWEMAYYVISSLYNKSYQ